MAGVPDDLFRLTATPGVAGALYCRQCAPNGAFGCTGRQGDKQTKQTNVHCWGVSVNLVRALKEAVSNWVYLGLFVVRDGGGV